MSQYLLLLRDDEAKYQSMAPQDFEELFQQFARWAEELQTAGVLRAVEHLTTPAAGLTLRRRQGAFVVDGPYVEGKESVLGFFVIEARDAPHAARIASGCPHLRHGGVVELRETFPLLKPLVPTVPKSP